MSHSPATSDAMCIIPPQSWGNEYYVAAYAGIDDPRGGSGDEPSEFGIIADQDSTSVVIVPSCPIRSRTDPSEVAHVRGTPFTVRLDKGETVQFQSIHDNALSSEEKDVTGTHITSSVPVGVIGGSKCAFIPSDFPYCDYICEMIPPVSSWGTVYYSAPFTKRKKGDTFGLLASAPNQIIYVTDSTAKHMYAMINPGEPFWDNSVFGVRKWESDKPFLVAQYINGSEFDQNSTHTGDPAEVVLETPSNYPKSLTAIVPATEGSEQPYTNYMTLIVRKEAEPTTTINGNNLTGQPKVSLDDRYDAYTISQINGTPVKPGSYQIQSDSGIWAYYYGYGSDESYAAPATLGRIVVSTLPTDTVPPNATFAETCFHVEVSLSDSGTLQIVRESSQNMNVSSALNHYSLSVWDSTQPASATVSAHDAAGNWTNIVTTYQPQVVRITPSHLSLGTADLAKQIQMIAYDTIENIGTKPIAISSITVGNANGFSLDSASTLALAAGERRVIKISFLPTSKGQFSDSLVFQSDCIYDVVSLGGWGDTLLIHDTTSGVFEHLGSKTQLHFDGHWLTINASETAAYPIELSLENILGIPVQTWRLSLPEAIDLNSLPHGVYFYRLSSGRESVTGKIVL